MASGRFVLAEIMPGRSVADAPRPVFAECATRRHGDAVGYRSCRGEEEGEPGGSAAAGRGHRGRAPMSEDERPGEDDGQDELIAAFAALGGRLTGDEFMRLLGSAEYYGSVVRLAGLLLAGDTAAAEAVARDSLAALQQAWSRMSDPEKARVYLYRTVLNRARSVRRDGAISECETPQAAPDALGAGHSAADDLSREPWACAVRALPVRQREAMVLHYYLGLSGQQAAEVMCISAGAARSHLARGMSSFRRPLGPE